MKVEFEVELNGMRDMATLVGVGLLAAAIVTELRKPPAARSWNGRLAGWIPYDFRPPTLGRLIRQWWNPDNPRFITETPFGVGWTVNVGRLARRVKN